MEITLFGKRFFISKILIFSVTIFLIIGSGVLGYFLKQVYQPFSNSDIVENNTEIVQSKAVEPSDESAKSEEEPEDIKVYVVGCVNKPGVVVIKKGQVIDDAIKMAGGATKDADLENINLAYKLDQNTMLRIKSKTSKANKTQQQSNASAAVTNKTANVDKVNSGIDIVTNSLGAVMEEEDEKENSNKKNSLVNINKASQAELENLPNVGPATAKAIIDYREKNGEFKKITDIMKITGIKQKTYDKIKDYICI